LVNNYSACSVAHVTFSSTAIEIIKWVKNFAVAQAKMTRILRPGKASEKTPKGVIPPSLCEISQNTSRKKKCLFLYFHQDAVLFLLDVNTDIVVIPSAFLICTFLPMDALPA
jgi:hypothetical protein